MKKAWRLKAIFGDTYIALYAEDGTELDVYKESTYNATIAARKFSLKEYQNGIPQKIKWRLNDELLARGLFTKFVERRNDNV